MKFYLLLIFIIASTFAIAQIPPKQEPSTAFGRGIGISLSKSSSERVSISQKGNLFRFNIPNKEEQPYIYEGLTFTKYGFIVKKDGKYGIANHQAQIQGKIDFDSIGIGYNSFEQLYLVKKGAKYGLLDTLGNLSVKLVYDKLMFESNGSYYLAHKNNRIGTLNPLGQVQINPDFHSIAFFSSNYPYGLIKDEEGKISLYSIHKKKIIPQEIDHAVLYKNLIVIKNKGKVGGLFIDSLGNIINKIPFDYDRIIPSLPLRQNYPANLNIIPENKGLLAKEIILEKNGKFTLIDQHAKPLLSQEFDLISGELLAAGSYYFKLKQGSKFGAYFPKTGKTIPVEMDHIKEGLKEAVIVKKGQFSGVYSTKGDPIIPVEYNWVSSEMFGYRVAKGLKIGLFNDEGVELVPAVFESISRILSLDDNVFEVEDNGLKGVYRVGQGLIIPAKYDFIIASGTEFLVSTKEELRKQGILDKNGKVIVPVENNFIYSSYDSEGSINIVERRNDEKYLYNKNWQKVLAEPIVDFNFLHDANNLVFLPEYNEISYIYVQNKNEKVGLLNLHNQQLIIPFEYDAILQKFKDSRTCYFLAVKNGKYGVINEKNEIIIPFQYESMNLDLMVEQISENPEENIDYRFVAVYKGKYGAVNLQNKAVIPFVYTHLERIGGEELFKAKKEKSYMLIDAENHVLNNGPFDEIGQFEFIEEIGEQRREALAFQNGQMRRISGQGEFLSSPIPMLPSKGYKSFKELKMAFVAALESKDNQLLKEFASKVSPSEQTLYYFEGTRVPLKYQNIQIDEVIEETFNQLMLFKEQTWSNPNFEKSILLGDTDYSTYQEGIITNYNAVFNRYSKERFLERLLGNCVKINGNWISTYFTYLYR